MAADTDDEIEVTLEMIEAGVTKGLYGIHADPDEQEERRMVAQVFKAMFSEYLKERALTP